MERPLLNSPEPFPHAQVLRGVIGESYPAFERLVEALAAPPFGQEAEWKYYNDGKAWLCRVCRGKKTLLWLSAWDGFFKAGFFFTEKHVQGVLALPIGEAIKEEFCRAKPAGKLLPLIISVHGEEQIADVLTVAAFKKNFQ